MNPATWVAEAAGATPPSPAALPRSALPATAATCSIRASISRRERVPVCSSKTVVGHPWPPPIEQGLARRWVVDAGVRHREARQERLRVGAAVLGVQTDERHLARVPLREALEEAELGLAVRAPRRPLVDHHGHAAQRRELGRDRAADDAAGAFPVGGDLSRDALLRRCQRDGSHLRGGRCGPTRRRPRRRSPPGRRASRLPGGAVAVGRLVWPPPARRRGEPRAGAPCQPSRRRTHRSMSDRRACARLDPAERRQGFSRRARGAAGRSRCRRCHPAPRRAGP
jgi:hypothetical protein